MTSRRLSILKEEREAFNAWRKKPMPSVRAPVNGQSRVFGMVWEVGKLYGKATLLSVVRGRFDWIWYPRRTTNSGLLYSWVNNSICGHSIQKNKSAALTLAGGGPEGLHGRHTKMKLLLQHLLHPLNLWCRLGGRCGWFFRLYEKNLWKPLLRRCFTSKASSALFKSRWHISI
jgi:hypothetical protein